MRTSKPALKTKSAFNKVAFSAVRAHNTVDSIQAGLSDTADPILATDTNKKMAASIGDMVKSGRYLHSKEFVINNIENFYPHTLREIFSKNKGTKKKIALVRQTPSKKTRMNKYDAAVILRMLIKGVSVEKVLETYPQYSHSQILRVKAEYRSTRTEKQSSSMLEALLDIQKRLGHWI
jgi:hypothetical protein